MPGLGDYDPEAGGRSRRMRGANRARAELTTRASRQPRSGLTVAARQIVGDFLAVGFADRSAERLDHLGDFGIPNLPVHESRVHHDVVQAMARRAARLDFVASG